MLFQACFEINQLTLVPVYLLFTDLLGSTEKVCKGSFYFALPVIVQIADTVAIFANPDCMLKIATINKNNPVNKVISPL